VAAADMAGAAAILRAANPLPAICGRVCPQERQCESECSMGGRFRRWRSGTSSASSPTGSARSR
jgi:NADPH-dependent glutamate synthase beta subunit-like oxidoreductase